MSSSYVTFIVMLIVLSFTSLFTNLKAQSLTGSTWDIGYATVVYAGAPQTTGAAGYINWTAGVISLTDTTTGTSNSCRGAAVTETSGYNPTTNFNKCFKVFFGCPGNDVIGTSGNPYTDQNGDGMAFSFWKSSDTYNVSRANTCGGGLGYDNALTVGAAGKMITIEFDTYSSIGTSTVDGSYGGGIPGSGINDEISLHKDQVSNDAGLITTTAATNANAGNLEDGLEHAVCITYDATTHVLAVTIDAVSKLSYDMDLSTIDLNTYFGGATLNYTWSAGEYGATNLQTIGPAGSNIFGTMGHNPCTQAVVLPVTLLSFSGTMVNENVVLNWATSSETNNKGFIIERSTNSSAWEAIGEVVGGGDATAVLNYNFTDYAPLNGLVYYRLRQVDLDGTISYSNIVVVKSELAPSVSIGSNPFENELTINTNIKEELNISIHDIVGRLLYQASHKSANGAVLIQPDLANGAYVLTIQTDTFIEQQRIIKK